jgi:hypothetical protein
MPPKQRNKPKKARHQSNITHYSGKGYPVPAIVTTDPTPHERQSTGQSSISTRSFASEIKGEGLKRGVKGTDLAIVEFVSESVIESGYHTRQTSFDKNLTTDPDQGPVTGTGTSSAVSLDPTDSLFESRISSNEPIIVDVRALILLFI